MDLSTSSLTTSLSAAGQSAIEFKDVRLAFDEGEILGGVTFSAQERETVILLGETGTGKTLLLKLASGLLRPDSGSIQVLGKDISGMAESDLLEIRRQIGFVFQEGPSRRWRRRRRNRAARQGSPPFRRTRPHH